MRSHFSTLPLRKSFLSALVLFSSTSLSAQEFRTYVGEDNAVWESPTNWNPNLVPDSITEGAVLNSLNVNVGSDIVIFTLELKGTSRVIINQSNELRTSNLLMQGTIAGTGTLRIMEGGSIGTGNSNLIDTATVINQGTLEISGFRLTNDALFRNENTLNLFDNASISDSGLLSGKTTPSLINTGFIRKDVGTGQATIAAPFDNQQEISSTSGTLRITGSGTNSGVFRTGSGALITNISRDVTFLDGSKITGEGEFRHSAKIIVPSAATVEFNNFTLTGLGRLAGEGDIQLIGDDLVFESGSLQENINVTITDNSTVFVKGGNSTSFEDTASLVIEPLARLVFDESNSSLWNNGAGNLINFGEIEFTENGDITNNGPIGPGRTLTFLNDGSIIKSGGLTQDGDTLIVGNIVHDGVIDVRQGRMEFIGDFEANAPLTVQPGATLRYGGISGNTLLMRAGSVVTGGGIFEHEQGTIEVEEGVRAVFNGYRTIGGSSGFVTGPGTFVFGTSETVSNIRHDGTGITEIPEGVEIVTTGQFDFDNDRTLRIIGSVDVSANPLSTNTGNVTFDLDGTLKLSANAFLNYGSGTFALQNDGELVIASPGTSGLGFNQYTGNGILRVESGKLRFGTSNLAVSGSIEVQRDAELEGNGLTFAPGSQLRGEGSVNGFPVNFGGTTNPGASIGTLSVAGRAELQSTSTLSIELGSGGSSDLLDISSSVIIGGTLDLSLANGYTPNEGDSWTILDATSISGGFEQINQPVIDAGHYFFVDYTATSVVVTYSRPNNFKWALEAATGENFTAGTNIRAQAELDPDGDGIPFLLEWIFGGDFLNADDNLKLEMINFDSNSPGTYTFRYPLNLMANDVDLSLKGSETINGVFADLVISNERNQIIDGRNYRLFDIALGSQNIDQFIRLIATLE